MISGFQNEYVFEYVYEYALKINCGVPVILRVKYISNLLGCVSL